MYYFEMINEISNYRCSLEKKKKKKKISHRLTAYSVGNVRRTNLQKKQISQKTLKSAMPSTNYLHEITTTSFYARDTNILYYIYHKSL